MFQWYFSDISRHSRNRTIALWWPFLCLVSASILSKHMSIFVFMTFKWWSLNENLFWKETSDERNCFIFLNKHRQLYSPVNVNNNFLPSNRNKARTCSALKIERFQIMFMCDIVFKKVFNKEVRTGMHVRIAQINYPIRRAKRAL